MDRSYDVERNAIDCQIVTKNRWMQGQVRTRYERLIDLLNADHTPVITVHDVSLVQQPGEAAVASTPVEVLFAIYRVLFAVPSVPAPTASPAPRRDTWLVRKEPELAVIGVGQYEIVGKIHLPQQSALSGDFLVTGLPFYAVTDASVRLLDGTPLAELPVLVVNRRRTEYIASAE